MPIDKLAGELEKNIYHTDFNKTHVIIAIVICIILVLILFVLSKYSSFIDNTISILLYAVIVCCLILFISYNVYKRRKRNAYVDEFLTKYYNKENIKDLRYYVRVLLDTRYKERHPNTKSIDETLYSLGSTVL